MERNYIQVTTRDLEKILRAAELKRQKQSDLSDTIVIEWLQPCGTHLGSDNLKVWIKYGYAEVFSYRLRWEDFEL